MSLYDEKNKNDDIKALLPSTHQLINLAQPTISRASAPHVYSFYQATFSRSACVAPARIRPHCLPLPSLNSPDLQPPTRRQTLHQISTFPTRHERGALHSLATPNYCLSVLFQGSTYFPSVVHVCMNDACITLTLTNHTTHLFVFIFQKTT